MRKRSVRWASIAAAVAVLTTAAYATASGATGDAEDRPTRPRIITAHRFARLQGPPPPGALEPVPEGPTFDRNGDLSFVTVYGDENGNKVFKLDMATRQVTPIYGDATSVFTGLDIHQDGRLFLADFGGERIVAMQPDGTGVETVVSGGFGELPLFPDDLVFGSDGDLYFTDMTGEPTHPTGRVFRRTATGELVLLAENLAFPNGISITDDEARLWISEHLAHRILTIGLDADGNTAQRPFGADIGVTANTAGPGRPDSSAVDVDGNLYQAFWPGAHVVVFSPEGAVIARVELPARDREQFHGTTNVVVQPGTRDAFLTAGGPGGAMLFRFGALAAGPVPFAQR